MKRLAALGTALLLVVGAESAVASTHHRHSVHRRHGYIVGTAKSECGKPLNSFDVNAYGFDGQPNVYPTGTPPIGSTKGHHGRYALRTVDSIRHVKPVNALVTGVEAQTTVKYDGFKYVLPLDPADGKRKFVGHSGKGLVRNFVLRTSGIKPGFEGVRNDFFDPKEEAAGAFYGANLILAMNVGNLPGSVFTLAFKPTGRLADGCPAKAFTRSMTLGPYQGVDTMYFHDIPLGTWVMSGFLTTGSTTRPVQLQQDSGPTTTALPLKFPPTDIFGDGSAALYINVT